MAVQAVGQTAGVAPTRSVYDASGPPAQGNAFSSFIEGFLGTRLPDSRMLFRYWLESQDPSARLKAIADLQAEKTALMGQRSKLAIAQGNDALGYAKLRSAEKIAQLESATEMAKQDRPPQGSAAETDMLLAEAAFNRAQAAALGGDSKLAQQEARTAAEAMRRSAQAAGTRGEQGYLASLATRWTGQWERMRDQNQGKADPGAINFGMTELPTITPGIRLTEDGPMGGSVSVEAGSSTRGPAARSGATTASTRPGSPGRVQVSGGGQDDPVLDAQLASIDELIEWAKTARFGDVRPTPYAPLAPKEPRMMPRNWPTAVDFMRPAGAMGEERLAQPPRKPKPTEPGRPDLDLDLDALEDVPDQVAALTGPGALVPPVRAAAATRTGDEARKRFSAALEAAGPPQEERVAEFTADRDPADDIRFAPQTSPPGPGPAAAAAKRSAAKRGSTGSFMGVAAPMAPAAEAERTREQELMRRLQEEEGVEAEAPATPGGEQGANLDRSIKARARRWASLTARA